MPLDQNLIRGGAGRSERPVWGNRSGSIVVPRTAATLRTPGVQDEPPAWISTAIWGEMWPVFQGPDHFARFHDRLVATPLEMQVRRSQNIEIRDRHDQDSHRPS